MKNLLITFFCVFGFLTGNSQVKDKALTTSITKEAIIMGKYFIDKDYEHYITYLHPAVFTLSKTTPKELADKMREQDKALKQRAAFYKSINFGHPSRIIDTANTLQCILPENICISAKGKDYINHNFVLAQSADHGKKWTFIEISAQNAGELKKAIPISSKHNIPETRVEQGK